MYNKTDAMLCFLLLLLAPVPIVIFCRQFLDTDRSYPTSETRRVSTILNTLAIIFIVVFIVLIARGV